MGNRRKIRKARLFGLILILLLIGYFAYNNAYVPSQKEYTTKVYADNNLLIDQIKFKNNSKIQVLNQDETIKNEIDLNKETNKVIIKAQGKDNLLLDSWEIKEETNKEKKFYRKESKYFIAKPLYIDKQDYVLTFKGDQRSSVIENDKPVKYTRKPYKKDTVINDYLPDVKTVENYNGNWFIGDSKISKDTKITSDTILTFKTFQDVNDNRLNDFTEKFKVSYVTNTDEKVEDKVVLWQSKVPLPKLQSKEKVFYDWYLDKDLKNKVKENHKISKDTTLYAKNKDFKKIINTTIKKPIDREDISLQVKNILGEQNKKVDLKYNQEIEKKEKEREEKKKYNIENKVATENVELVINFHNLNQNKLNLVTFLDSSNNFIYSIIVPYGQIVKVLDENEKLSKEYAIRQNTTIILDEKELVSSSSTLNKYNSQYRQINDTVFIKIQPEIKK